ncbi:MAG: BPTI/Kunitz domain-containing protein [Pseudomonadota bacterium]
MPVDCSKPPIRAGSLVCALAVSLFVACGGTAVNGPYVNQAGANSTSGASSVAGANPVAGAGSTAGASSVAGAGPSPGAGAGGSTANDDCTLPMDPGPCAADYPSFWHDPKTNLCVPFAYGGCGGNANRYPTRDLCMRLCTTASDDWTTCVTDDGCTLINASCCGPCDPVANETLLAVNRAHASMYTSTHCANAGACLPCKQIPENEQTRKYLKATCRNKQCTATDVRESALSECQTTSDCMLRDGAECCPGCDGYGWVPLNKFADVCGGAVLACDDCSSPLPNDWNTVCLSGRCRLEGPL